MACPERWGLGCRSWVQICPKFLLCNCCGFCIIVSYITAIYRESVVTAISFEWRTPVLLYPNFNWTVVTWRWWHITGMMVLPTTARWNTLWQVTVMVDYRIALKFDRYLGSLSKSLRWRHNDHNGVSNHQPHHCLLNCLFGRRSGTGEFPAQVASDTENVYIWWRHHDSDNSKYQSRGFVRPREILQ